MNTKYAKTAENKVERVTTTHVQVTVLSGPSKGKAYAIMTTVDGYVGSCQCSWSRRNGTTCSHVRDASKFLEQELAPVVKVEAKSSFQTWLDEAIEGGDLIFASK